MKKRPATHQPCKEPTKQRRTPQPDSVEPVHYEADTTCSAELADWQIPVDVEESAWASHAVKILVEGKLLPCRPTQTSVTLNMWADCAGMVTEMFAGRKVTKALSEEIGLNVCWRLFCACEKDPRARAFIRSNHSPMHTSDDMLHRDFGSGQYYCDQCGANHDLPETGIDVYVAGYPCSPWSRRGLRSDFNHPDIKPLLIGLQTVNYMRPALWLMETTEGVDDHRDGSAESALDNVRRLIKKEVHRATYFSHIVRNLSPVWSGYPTRRPRVFILNWRADVCQPEVALQPLTAFLAQPVPLAHNYWSMLKLDRPVDWSRVDEYPGRDELAALQANLEGCVCHVDPMLVCPRHPCPPVCGRCGVTGTECIWRHKMQKYLAEHQPNLLAQSTGKLTYLQVLELSGRQGPTNPRQRNLLNVFALLSQARPLNETLMLTDLSQSVDMAVLQKDGSLPTLARNSAIFCFRAGRLLTTAEKAALMGFDLGEMQFPQGCSEAWLRERLGLSIHVASLGLMLLALVSSPLSKMAE